MVVTKRKIVLNSYISIKTYRFIYGYIVGSAKVDG